FIECVSFFLTLHEIPPMIAVAGIVSTCVPIYENVVREVFIIPVERMTNRVCKFMLIDVGIIQYVVFHKLTRCTVVSWPMSRISICPGRSTRACPDAIPVQNVIMPRRRNLREWHSLVSYRGSDNGKIIQERLPRFEPDSALAC